MRLNQSSENSSVGSSLQDAQAKKVKKQTTEKMSNDLVKIVAHLSPKSLKYLAQNTVM